MNISMPRLSPRLRRIFDALSSPFPWSASSPPCSFRVCPPYWYEALVLCRRPFIRVRDGLSSKVRVYRPDIDVKEGLPFGCGQCLACRINKRRQWTLRLLLEYTQHEKGTFCTLTYSPENLPLHPDDTDGSQGVLCKRDVQLFLKRLRKRFPDDKIRFYCAGEYGPNNTHRPHYHLILFGISPDELDPDWFFFRGRSGPCPEQGGMRKTPLYELWQYGIVHVGEVNEDSIGYVAGYVTSKLTRKGDGRTPEFALMSRMPGLGLSALFDVARMLQAISQDSSGPINPRQIHLNGHLWPSGRYVLSKLRIISDIRDGLEEYIASCATLYRESELKGVDFLTYLVESDAQSFHNLETKQRIFRKRSKFE